LIQPVRGILLLNHNILKPETLMPKNSATDQLITAILNKDVHGVKQALLDGADVNRGWNEVHSVPVWLYSICIKDHIWSTTYATWPYSKEHAAEDRAAYGKIFDMIISKAKNVSSPDEFHSSRGLSTSRIFRLSNTEAASSIVMAAIKETNGNVPINLSEMFSVNGDAKDPYHPTRKHLKQQIMKTHNRVSECLLKPTTPFDKGAAASLSDAGKAYWLEPLAFPDLADLPMSTQQFIDACDQRSRGARTAPASSRPLPPLPSRRGGGQLPRQDQAA
jgi:hypothetical protein